MQALLIVVVLGLIMLALWCWDERTRRVERHRRQLENRQRQGRAMAPYATSPSKLTSAT